MAHVAFVTHEAAPELQPDDRLASHALAEAGITVEAIPWSSPRAQWDRYQLVILRSCWDYHRRHRAFLDWVARVEARGVPLWNPTRLVRWNVDKGYLRDLASLGVPIIPTVWLDQNAPVNLSAVLDREGWARAVVKPTVSANGYETWFTSPTVAVDHEKSFQTLLQAGGVLVQEFIPQVQKDGEWSFVFLGDRFSHAVLKHPAPGDFRTQLEYGGRFAPIAPDSALLRQAQQVVDAIGGPWLYARVDGCVVEGELRLMELELIEPSLYLAYHPEAPRRLAQAVANLIENGRPERAVS